MKLCIHSLSWKGPWEITLLKMALLDTAGCVTRQADQGVSHWRTGLAGPTLLAEAWFQNGLIAGDTDTFHLVLPGTYPAPKEFGSFCLSS